MELRVLIVMPRGRDAGLAAGILGKAGITSRVCSDFADLVRAAEEDAGAALIAEEALDADDHGSSLLRWVAAQPPWSDFPVIVLAAPRGDVAQGARVPAWFAGLGNIVLLERPMGAAALTSAVRTVLRARRRQYQMRTYLAERETATLQLSALNASLETRVTQRTTELQAAYDRLAKEAVEREQTKALLAQAQRMEALGQLAGGIAHDFNNVLQAVSGGLSLIERRADSEMVKRLAGMAGDAAQRGASITGRLLAFARQGALRGEAVSPRRLLESLHEMLAHTIGAGIRMQVAASESLPLLLADKGQLETVLVNLAVNARDAMPDGGLLSLSAAPETVRETGLHAAGLGVGRFLCLSVSDTGMGMNAATLARASEPFFTTKPLGQGTGLGLAMARGFAQQSGGGMAIESASGKGTTVKLWFPEAAGAAEVNGAVSLVLPTRSVRAGTCVLIVDDDVSVREVLVSEMTGLGYEVSQARDGLEALAHIDEGATIHLLISDFAMPGMNGLALIQEARRRRPDLPALLLTGYADASVRLAAEQADIGDTALLRKPASGVDLAQSAATLLAHASRKPDRKPATVVCQDIL